MLHFITGLTPPPDDATTFHQLFGLSERLEKSGLCCTSLCSLEQRVLQLVHKGLLFP